MITLEIPQTGRILYLPENLEECDARQYAEACLLIFKYQTDLLTVKDFKMEMIYKLLDLKKGKRKISEAEQEDMFSNISQLTVFVDSFFEETEGALVIKQDYTKNHSQVIQDSFKKWYGPEDDFENITFGQYIDALDIYSHLEIEPTEDLLFRLMAIFYHKKGHKYDPKKSPANARHFKFVHFGRVYGFFLLFASFQKYLFSARVLYQGKELDLSILFSKAEGESEDESEIPGIGMLSIAHQLAESGVYGPIQEVRATNFWEVILRLYDIRKRDLDNEARRKKEETEAKRNSKTGKK